MVRGTPNPRYLGLPSRLRKARKQSRLTRRALAQQAGGGNAIALYVETGKQLPTVATVARLASALGVSAAWLAYGLGEPISVDAEAGTDGLGARLQGIRVEQSFTKAELGRRSGLTAPSITQIENGGSSGLHIVEALAEALGVSPAWLAFNQGPQVLPSRRGGRPPTKPAESAEPAA